MPEIEPNLIIGQEILHQQGHFRRRRLWLRGQHPQLGILNPPWMGLSGDWETVVEVDGVSPIGTFVVDNAVTLAGHQE